MRADYLLERGARLMQEYHLLLQAEDSARACALCQEARRLALDTDGEMQLFFASLASFLDRLPAQEAVFSWDDAERIIGTDRRAAMALYNI